LKKKNGEEETRLKLKQNTSMDQEPYPNQEDGCTKGLDGSRYQLMDVLGVGEEEIHGRHQEVDEMHRK